MGQKLFDDKIGTVNYSGGNIVMSASITTPAYLTIGGQQYKITTALSASAILAAKNTRYQVYAVLSAGVPTLVVSSNENSQGPTGYTVWKLIASYYSNGKATIGFGSFINIEGTPQTIEAIEYDMDIQGQTTAPTKGTTTPGYDKAAWHRIGKHIFIVYNFFNAGGVGTAGSGAYIFPLPDVVYDHLSSEGIAPGNLVQPIVGWAEGNNSSSTGTGYVCMFDVNRMHLALTGTATPTPNIVGSTHYNLTQITTFSFNAKVPVVGWSGKPIKDL